MVPVKRLVFIIDIVGVILNFTAVAMSYMTQSWLLFGWSAIWSFYFLNKTLKTIDELVEAKNEIHD